MVSSLLIYSKGVQCGVLLWLAQTTNMENGHLFVTDTNHKPTGHIAIEFNYVCDTCV